MHRCNGINSNRIFYQTGAFYEIIFIGSVNKPFLKISQHHLLFFNYLKHHEMSKNKAENHNKETNMPSSVINVPVEIFKLLGDSYYEFHSR